MNQSPAVKGPSLGLKATGLFELSGPLGSRNVIPLRLSLAAKVSRKPSTGQQWVWPGTRILLEPAGLASGSLRVFAAGDTAWLAWPSAREHVAPSPLWATGSPSTRRCVLHEKLCFMLFPFPGCHPVITPTHFLQLYFVDDKHFCFLVLGELQT